MARHLAPAPPFNSLESASKAGPRGLVCLIIRQHDKSRMIALTERRPRPSTVSQIIENWDYASTLSRAATLATASLWLGLPGLILNQMA
jgi:hypothetical protein